MEIMAQVVNKKIILLVLFLFFSTKNIAQQKIDKDISFSYKENGKTKYMNIDFFLTNFPNQFSKIVDIIKCGSSSGLFKFEINPESKIVDITVKGNLHEEIIKAIKNQIILSEQYWIINDPLKKRKENIIFYFSYYLYVDLEDNCNSDYHHESLKLLKMLFKNQKVINVSNNVYLINPIYGSAQR
jgi:hypothetical protein